MSTVHDRTAKALLSGNAGQLFTARKLHLEHPLTTSLVDAYGLSLAQVDGPGARAAITSGLQHGLLSEYFTVQDLYLRLLEDGQRATDLDADGIYQLEQIARDGKSGSGAARAWLSLLGQQWNEEVILPKPVRSFQAQEMPLVDTEAPFIEAYPNPTNGPVYLVVHLPEGASEGLVRVMDPLGRLLVEQRFAGSVQVIDMNTSGEATGLYTAGLYVDGLDLGTIKFEVLR
jgi:hypothetical protein